MLKSLATISVLFLVASCASMTVKDFKGCAIEGALGAHCNQYLTNAPIDYDKQTWDKMSFGWIAISPDSFAEIKNEIETACSQLNCSYEQVQTVNSFFLKMWRAQHSNFR